MPTKPAKLAKKSKEDPVVEGLLHAIEDVPATGIIETGIDTIYALVKERKTVRLSALAKAAGVSPSTAMHWVSILEQNGLVKRHYPMFGDVRVTLP